MRILGLSTRASGCGYHRIAIPMHLMECTGTITDTPTAEILARGFDIIFYNRVSPFDEHWEQTKGETGCKVVLDMDDDWDLPPNHIVKEVYDVIKPRIENNMRQADMIFCTNERLRDKIAKINPNVHVITNAIPYGLDQFHDWKIDSEYIRLFWCGSVTHEHDINILKYPLMRLSDKRVQMVMGGYSDANEASIMIWDRMASVFTNNKRIAYKILRGTDPDRYMEMYQEGDIMLVPLEHSTWHASKSNLKLLEAAAKKMPCIVSHVEPYSRDEDAPVLWVKNQSDWFKHINYLINNENARQDYGEKLYEWAKEKYNYERINAERYRLLRGLIQV